MAAREIQKITPHDVTTNGRGDMTDFAEVKAREEPAKAMRLLLDPTV